MSCEIYGEDNLFGRSIIAGSVQALLIERAEENLEVDALAVQLACQRVLGFRNLYPRLGQLSVYSAAGAKMLELLGEGDTVVFRDNVVIEYGFIDVKE